MVTFRYIEHLWISGLKEQAFQQLAHFTQVALNPQNIHFLGNDESQQIQQRNELNKLLSRCYLKLGQWHENLQGINESSIPLILQYYLAATDRDNNWYKAWHSWAYMNFEAVHFYKVLF
jgi:FKBP12-rapamycin complex-associated protein